MSVDAPPHDHHGHDHGHGAAGHSHSHGAHGHHAPPSDWRYGAGIILNLGFVIAEVVFGLISHSTALLADAGHNLSDVLGLVLAGVAAWLAKQSAAEHKTYGYGKTTILAALANAIVLVFACGAIAMEAAGRFMNPEPVGGMTVMAVAFAGFLVNGATALMFMRGREKDLNVRGAFLHMAADAAVSIGVVIVGAVIWFTGWSWADPVASLLILGVILMSTWGLLKESFDMAIDAAPSHVKVAEVRDYLCGLPGVSAVHDMHVWNLSTTETALTVHLVRDHPADTAFLAAIQAEVKQRFAISHATVQVETGALEDCPNC